MIRTLKGKGHRTLLFDAGDFSGSQSGPGPAQTLCLLDGMRHIGYDAVALGERDLGDGQSFLMQASRHLGARFLAANVVDRATGALVGEAMRTFRAGGIRIGPWRMGGLRVVVLGITRDDVPADLLESGGSAMTVKSPEEELGRLLPVARRKADLLIVIAHLGKERALALAQQVEGVDLVISGHGGGYVSEPITAEGTLLVHPGERGQSVGDLMLVVKRGQGIVSWTGTETMLDVTLPEDKEIASLVGECLGQGVAKGEAVEGEATPQPPRGPGEAAAPRPPRALYMGADACRDCHRAIFASWSQTPHARAFATLEAEGKADDPACTRCHTTGFGRGNGFRAVEWTPRMKNVQCEECHGPASIHVSGVSVPGHLSRGGRPACARCHNREQDPDFDYDREMKNGSHP